MEEERQKSGETRGGKQVRGIKVLVAKELAEDDEPFVPLLFRGCGEQHESLTGLDVDRKPLSSD